MKKTYFFFRTSFIILLMASTLFFSCKKKKFDDALPILTLESVSTGNLDSVILTGKITSPGAANIEYWGFAFSEKPSFSLISNQVLVKGKNTGEFQAVVHAFHDSTYYFRAFAANSFGYKASNVIKYTVLKPVPAVAPCTLTNNYMNDGGSGFPVSAFGSAVNPQYGNYTVTLYGSTEDIALSFPYAPINGIYTTTSDGSALGSGQVYINISRFNQYVVNSGGKVYVAVDSVGKTTLSTCGVQYNNGSSNVTLYGKASY